MSPFLSNCLICWWLWLFVFCSSTQVWMKQRIKVESGCVHLCCPIVTLELQLYLLVFEVEIHLSPEIVFRKCRQCYSVITYFFSPNNNTNDQKRKRNKTKVQLSNKIFGCYDKITLTKLILYLSPADKSSEQWLYTTIITVR